MESLTPPPDKELPRALCINGNKETLLSRRLCLPAAPQVHGLSGLSRRHNKLPVTHGSKQSPLRL